MANRNTQRLLRNILLGVFFFCIIVFAFFGSYNLVFGVKIKNINIQNGASVMTATTQISGTAKNAVLLSLNGREISIDKNGNFNETIALSPGYNIISIEAKDKFGSIDEKDYQLIYKQNDQEGENQ